MPLGSYHCLESLNSLILKTLGADILSSYCFLLKTDNIITNKLMEVFYENKND